MSAQPHDPSNLSSSDFVQLEVVRGLAALVVVFNHARGWLWAGGSASTASHATDAYGPLEWAFFVGNQLTRCGHEAVILFFVLSGYSIAHSLRPRDNAKARSIPRFLQRRAVRLYPPYLAGLLWAALVAWLIPMLLPDPSACEPLIRGAAKLGQQGAVDHLRNLFYDPQLPFVPQYWSLAHEVVFYFLAPFVFRRVRAYIGVSLALGLVGVVTLGRFVDEGFVADFLLRYNVFFAIGALLYRNHGRWYAATMRVHAALLGVALCFGFLLMVALNYRLGHGWASEGVAVVLALISVPLVLRLQPRNKLLLWLGAQSYSLYVSHVATVALTMAVLVGVFGFEHPFFVPYVWLLALVPALLVSTAIYGVAELPTRMWLSRARAAVAAPPSGPELASASGPVESGRSEDGEVAARDPLDAEVP